MNKNNNANSVQNMMNEFTANATATPNNLVSPIMNEWYNALNDMEEAFTGFANGVHDSDIQESPEECIQSHIQAIPFHMLSHVSKVLNIRPRGIEIGANGRISKVNSSGKNTYMGLEITSMRPSPAWRKTGTIITPFDSVMNMLKTNWVKRFRGTMTLNEIAITRHFLGYGMPVFRDGRLVDVDFTR